MAVTKVQILSLYKNLLREALKFPAYNFRMYGIRRVRDGFRMNKTIKDGSQIATLYKDGLKNLELLKRQVVIFSLYKTEPIVVEKVYKGKGITRIRKCNKKIE